MTSAVIRNAGEGRTIAVVGDVYRFLVLTVWLSRMAALGSASRSSTWRTVPTRSSGTCCQTPAQRQRR